MTGISYNTRIAPSPTGDMHLGTARTGYFNWLLARATGGVFTVRVDDTDTERNKPECINVIFDTFQWLGLNHDRTFRQSERTARYIEASQALLSVGLACRVKDGAIALHWHEGMPREWVDELAGPMPITDTNIAQINGTVPDHLSDGLILVRSNGCPTYQYCSTLDDFDFDIDFVCRGVDHISNTPKQLAIWWALDNLYDQHSTIPKFAHIGLIHKDKKKLSKRDNCASLLLYRDAGYSVDALLNFMLRLGWGTQEANNGNDLINKELAVKLFMKGKMRNTPANFDEAFLKRLDRQHKALAHV